MRAWQILNAEPENYSPRALETLQAIGSVRSEGQTRSSLLANLADVDVLIVRLAFKLDEEVFSAAPNLRAVVSATTGLDHIDLAAAERHGVQVLSLRGEVDFLRSIPATAELTWGLLLALTRRIPVAFNSVLAGRWQRDDFKGHDLAGRRLGILGLGRIGRMVAGFGLAFGMRVLAYDPHPLQWLEGVERTDGMPELLEQANVLSIHVPLNPSTKELVGAAELSRLPAGALLVNTSRGDVLDEAALLADLEKGHLAGAALDVLCHERSEALAGSRLIAYARTHSNLILTPHIGGATYESMAATEIFMAHKLCEFLKTLE
jgi:D-3-phosphoglycerate dehydrogenase / 2-oxoglutarate reductase